MNPAGYLGKWIVAMAALATAVPLFAQDAIGILDDRDAGNAAPQSLQAEARLFEDIRQGIALSIAQCELSPANCTPTVSREEVRRIVEKLEGRLDALTSRHSESGDAELEPVLLAYVETRDGYTQFLNKLDTLLPPEGESGEPVDLGQLPEEFAIFADADAELIDDADDSVVDEVPADTQ